MTAGLVAKAQPCVTGAAGADEGVCKGCSVAVGPGVRAVEEVAICDALLAGAAGCAAFDEKTLPKKDPTPDKPWLIEEPMLENVVPTPLLPGCAAATGGVLAPGTGESVVAGGEDGGVAAATGGCVFFAAVAAVVCHADVAAPDDDDEICGTATVGGVTGTDLATAVLGTPAPGFNPCGTLAPRPASL